MAVAKMDKEKEPRENAIVRTFREVRSEMKKVVWPIARGDHSADRGCDCALHGN